MSCNEANPEDFSLNLSFQEACSQTLAEATTSSSDADGGVMTSQASQNEDDDVITNSPAITESQADDQVAVTSHAPETLSQEDASTAAAADELEDAAVYAGSIFPYA